MAGNPNAREGNCCYGHKSGCAAHKLPLVDGKPFRFLEHRPMLLQAGLTTKHPELTEGKPKGAPKKVNGVLVYPPPHFA